MIKVKNPASSWLGVLYAKPGACRVFSSFSSFVIAFSDSCCFIQQESEKAITKLEISNGNITVDPLEIKNAFKMFYETIYNSEYNNATRMQYLFPNKTDIPKVSEEGKEKVDRQISIHEIIDAINSLNAGKIPLSQLLFLLATEPFAIAVRTSGQIQGVKIGRKEHRITSFADDVSHLEATFVVIWRYINKIELN